MSSRRRQGKSPVALQLYFVVVLAYLLLPMLLVIPMSFSETRFLKFPPTGLTLRWYGEFFSTSGWLEATGRSLLIAALSALLATIVGTLASLVIARGTMWAGIGKTALLGPQVVPVIILALGSLLVFSQLDIYGSILGIVFVHAVLALPFVVTTVAGALRQTGDTLTKAARVMGAGPWRTFFYVTLPIIRPSAIAGAIFAFFISFDELVIALFVLGQNETLPMRIWADMRQDLTPVVAAVATLLIVVTFVSLLIAEFARRRMASLNPTG